MSKLKTRLETRLELGQSSELASMRYINQGLYSHVGGIWGLLLFMINSHDGLEFCLGLPMKIDYNSETAVFSFIFFLS
jgi:hypothetical protein